MLVLGALAALAGCTSTTGSGVGGAGGTGGVGGAGAGGAGGSAVPQCANISGIHVATSALAFTTPPTSYFARATAYCPGGMVAIGGGGQFVDAAGTTTKDGAMMSSVPLGGSPTMPPTGWVFSGSTQFTGAGGQGVGDALIAYAVCAAPGTNPSTMTTAEPLVLTPTPPPQNYFLSTTAICPAGQKALGGGVRFADASPMPKDGMVMSSLPDYTGSNAPTGWLASGSAQFTTVGGEGLGDHLDVQAVCADVCAATAIEVVTAQSLPVPNYYHTITVTCPGTKVAISGGARFAGSSGTADGALMQSMPVFAPGGSPTGWAAAGSTQYLSGNGGGGPSDHLVVYAVCAVVSP